MLTIKTLREAETFVSRQQSLGNNVWWENYDIVFFRPAQEGVYSRDGAFKNGQWGFKNRSPVTSKGEWLVDYRNIRRAPSK